MAERTKGGRAPVAVWVRRLAWLLRAQGPGAALAQALAQAGQQRAWLLPFCRWVARRYTRNLIFVDRHMELLCVCWAPGSQSPIHDHASQHCLMAVAHGDLLLDTYAAAAAGEPLRLLRHGLLRPGQVDHRTPQEGLHRVAALATARAVSLHLYARPYSCCTAYADAAQAPRRLRLHYAGQGGRFCACCRHLDARPR